MTAGVQEALGEPGRTQSNKPDPETNLMLQDPEKFRAPHTTDTQITSVAVAEPFCLVVDMPGTIAKGTTAEIYTCPTGEKVLILDYFVIATGAETGGTVVLTSTNGAISTALTCAVDEVVTRPTVGWSNANDFIEAGETLVLTTASSGTDQCACRVIIWLAKVAA